MKPPTPALYLQAAATVRRGWSRRWYAEKDGSYAPYPKGDRFCAIGALALAAGLGPEAKSLGPDEEGADTLARPLVASLRRNGHVWINSDDEGAAELAVSVWNHGRASGEEVAVALERCAGELERGEIEP